MSLSDSGVQAFLEGKENQITERNTKVTNSVALVMEFIGAENVYLKDFLCYFFFRRKPFVTTHLDYNINDEDFSLSYVHEVK